MKLHQIQIAGILSLLAPTLVMAQNSSTETDSTASSLPYQITIRPEFTWSDLRKLIVDVEDDFYGKFNELNIDDAYDIYCYKYVPTMSHITQRVCEPLFMIDARGLNASEAAFNLVSPAGDGGHSGPGSTPLYSPSEMRNHEGLNYEVLQEKMEEFMHTDKEFSEIGSVLGKLKYRLQNRKKESN
ncbi:MAG: hypothetical protein COA96_16175 [SAR86 cluster bacterium]|uniref:Uncharacterized protein n=1 Tax=SAR86 cluster bacterium TaxID=2030880 RepID=A0A2A5AK56_9GAMM|nr:MAG: hypothetical protein COA96_16175 [SAR86 cluster bacterium]